MFAYVVPGLLTYYIILYLGIIYQGTNFYIGKPNLPKTKTC